MTYGASSGYPSVERSNAVAHAVADRLGSADFRRALLGATVGSTLTVGIALPPARTLQMSATGRLDALPRNGIKLGDLYYIDFIDPLGTASVSVSLAYGHRYEVTVRKACPARLLVRDVELIQHGPHMECAGLSCGLTTYRDARLQLALFDGHCAEGEPLHFGPIAMLDKDATDHPRAFQDTIKARIQHLVERWPTFSHATH